MLLRGDVLLPLQLAVAVLPTQTAVEGDLQNTKESKASAAAAGPNWETRVDPPSAQRSQWA